MVNVIDFTKGAIAAFSSILVVILARKDYARIAASTPIAVDAYVGEASPAFMDQLQCVLVHWYTRLSRTIHKDPFAIVAYKDPFIDGMFRTRAARKEEEPTKSQKPKPPLVIGTIRMGFGHHRLSYALASYATNNQKLTKERDIYFHDIVMIGNDEANLVDEAETLYSYGSRTLTELPNKLERMLSSTTSSGGTNALRMQVFEAALMIPLLAGLDKDCPIIATHPLVGAIAVAANFKNVINIVVDNHPQWFVVVPGALNLIQGPRLYRELMKLGVPENELELVGHWNPRNIVETIPEATDRRIQRLQQQKPLRLLIPVGGAGAQKSFLRGLLKACVPLVRQGKLQLFLNAGDHEHMKTTFHQELKESGLAEDDYEIISDVASVIRLEEHLKKDQEPPKPITVFAFHDGSSDSYGAVTTTDRLIPFSDVLVCKPSEMAFFAVPKLMIRRVGDHEAKSAVRAAELGEGTLEAATIPEVMKEIHQFLSKPSDLITMNKMIQKNHEIGMYNGAETAIERAIERSQQ